MKKLITVLVILVIFFIIFLLLGPFYILSEGEQAVVLRFGKLINTQTEAGLKIKAPLVDNVRKYSKKILAWDGDAQRIPTEENQFIWVDTTARWKITDAKRFYEAVTTMEQGYARLDDVINSAVRTVITQNPLPEAVRNSNVINEIERKSTLQQAEVEDQEGIQELSRITETSQEFEAIEKGRRELSDEMFENASALTPQYGIELIDIIIRQIRYSDDLTESVYQRMIKERNRLAQAYRSFGEGQKAEWMGKTENEKKAILSRAYARAEEIRGKADAEATSIYAQAYEADPEFFKFWRSIESYRRLLPKFKKTLTTDMEYFDYLYSEMGQ